jgi:hypothetical protein
MTIKTKILSLGISLPLLLSLAGCSAPPKMESGQAMSLMADAGLPCDYPVMDKFESPLESFTGFHCLDQEGSEVGYTVVFFADEAALSKSKDKACAEPLGPNAVKKYPDTEFLLGANWLATSDVGSKVSLEKLKEIFGGRVTSLKDACR